MTLNSLDPIINAPSSNSNLNRSLYLTFITFRIAKHASNPTQWRQIQSFKRENIPVKNYIWKHARVKHTIIVTEHSKEIVFWRRGYKASFNSRTRWGGLTGVQNASPTPDRGSQLAQAVGQARRERLLRHRIQSDCGHVSQVVVQASSVWLVATRLSGFHVWGKMTSVTCWGSTRKCWGEPWQSYMWIVECWFLTW